MTAVDMAWSASLKNTINLGNSIIGVSILAMPYCFEKCGIVLSFLLLLASGLVTRMTCHLLLKSAITARRRNYEFLAFHTFGPTGRLVVEIGILGFLLGSCVAFFVVMGDLAPPLASDFFLLEDSPRLRLTVLMLLGTCVGLPLGLLRRLDSLTSLSALSLGFYCLLVLKVFVESFPALWSGAWWDQVVLWRHDNLLSVLPIFAMALSCQPQLFEIFDTVNDPSLKRMNSVVSGAVHMCSIVYVMMGFFGYVAFCGVGGPMPGNVLVRLGSSLSSEFIKLGFVATLVVSFPLCLFPCRTSLHSLIFKRGSKFHDPSYDYIPDGQFRLLTVLLVGATLATACLVPNIEIVLGLTGSTIGTLICVIMPALVFTRIQVKSTNERLLAKFLSWAGVCIMVACTAATLSQVRPPERSFSPPHGSHFNPVAIAVSRPPAALLPKANLKLSNASPVPDLAKPPMPKAAAASPVPALSPKAVQPVTSLEKRLEPPEPVEPPVDKEVVPPPTAKPAPLLERPPKDEVALDPEALKKEDHEIAAAATSGKGLVPPVGGGLLPLMTTATPLAPPEVKKQEDLLEKIAQEQKVQKKMLEDLQRELKQELAKHKQDAMPPQKPNGTLADGAVQVDAVRRAPPAAVLIPAIPPIPASSSGGAKKLQLPTVQPVATAGAASGLLWKQDSQPLDKLPPPTPLAPVQNVLPQDLALKQAAAALPAQNLVQHPGHSSQQQLQANKVVNQTVKTPLSGRVPSVVPSYQHAAPVQPQQPPLKSAFPPPAQDINRKEEVVHAEDTGAFQQPPLAQAPKVVQPPIQQLRQQENAKVAQSLLSAQGIVGQNDVPPMVPAADRVAKASENVVRPLDFILHNNKQGIAHQPFAQKVPIAGDSKPNIVLQPALLLGENRIVKKAVEGKTENLLKPHVRPPETKEAAGVHAVAQLSDQKPLVAKMSRTVRREAPAEVPAEVPAEAPAVAPPKPSPKPASNVPEVVTPRIIGNKKSVVPAAAANAVHVGDISMKLDEEDSVVSPRSLASRVHADVVLAKHEIRK